jgi:transcriptional regulator GlxA family with amidase domain
LALIATHDLHNVGLVDTLLVSGGIGYGQAVGDAETVAWVSRMRHKVERLGSICTGAFILAAAGLLDNKRATTHWAYCERLAQEAPSTVVEPDAIFVREDDVFTSAGVTSGMDMALAMVEQDWGQPVALAVAQELVLYLQRPGGQSQFSRQLTLQQMETDKLQKLLLWMIEHPEADFCIDALAARVAMSPRNFMRRFAAEAGATPAKFAQQIRIEAARRKLEQTSLPLETIARSCGFSCAENMRRSFVRSLGISPSEYRERFCGHTIGAAHRAAIRTPEGRVLTA